MQSLALLIGIWMSTPAHAEPLAPPEMMSKDAQVWFWQTNLSAGNQGTCGVDFFFDGSNLEKAIEHLTLTVHIIDAGGHDLATEQMALETPLGGFGFQRFAKASLSSPEKWPGQDDGSLSPLCDHRTTLLVESAIGTQDGKTVDLVRSHKLGFTSFPKIKVKIK